MIPIVNWTERASDFPSHSVEMRPADTPDVRSRIGRLWDTDNVTYLGRGFNCAHHHVSGGRLDQDLVVRRMLAPIAALERRLDREYRFLDALRGIDYPHAPTPAGRIPADSIDGSPAFAMSFVRGARPSHDAHALEAFGRAVRQLHETPVPRALDDLYVDPREIVERSFARLTGNLATVRDTMAPEDLDAAVSLYRVLERALPTLDWRQSRPVLVHGDLGDHNVLVDGTAVALIDWEFGSVADAAFDLMWSFSLRTGFGASQQPWFLRGYGDLPTTAPNLVWLRRLALLDVVLWAQSGLDDIAAGRNLHFFGARDREFLRRLVDRIRREV